MRPVMLTIPLWLLSACGRCDSVDPAPEPALQPSTNPSAVRVSDDAGMSSNEVVVHHVGQLASIDLSKLEHLDLALSAGDLVGHLDDNDADSACQGLDLTTIAASATNLRSLRVSGCGDALRLGLHAFAPSVERIELADIEVDSALIGRIAALTKLQELELVRVTTTGAHVEPLARLPLRRLVLADLPTDSDLSKMLDLWPRTLRDVSLRGRWASHKAMLTLARATALQRLELTDTRVTNFSFHQIKELPSLAQLQLSGDTFNDSTPLYFRALPLTDLTCDCPRLSDGGLQALRRSDKLVRLELPRSAVTGAGLTHLADVSTLTHLALEGTTVDSEALSAMAALTKLEQLELSGTLEQPTMSGLGDLTNLTLLRLDLQGLDDRMTAELGKLESLEELYLAGSAISDDGLAAVASLPKLRILDLARTRVTNQGLRHLAELVELERLRLSNTDVVDDGVAYLAGLTNLRELQLGHTLVTDAGLDHLMQLENLERLDLAHTVVTAEGTTKLQQLPQLRVLGLEGTRAVDLAEG